MATKRNEQRIRLRAEGSPVKWDATVTETSADSKVITVRFDGPMGDVKLVAVDKHHMASNMFDRDGRPTEDYRMATQARLWEVL